MLPVLLLREVIATLGRMNEEEKLKFLWMGDRIQGQWFSKIMEGNYKIPRHLEMTQQSLKFLPQNPNMWTFCTAKCKIQAGSVPKQRYRFPVLHFKHVCGTVTGARECWRNKWTRACGADLVRPSVPSVCSTTEVVQRKFVYSNIYNTYWCSYTSAERSCKVIFFFFL